jgi:hypothetical protein
MDISQAVDMRNSLRANRVIMAYNGAVSDELMVTMADLLKNRMLSHDDPKRSKLVFSVFMEAVQNLIWHGRDRESPAGMIMIAEEDSGVCVICGNRISRTKSAELGQRLAQLQSADKDTLRQLYREGMSRSGEHEGPGAGLGLLEIVRRAVSPISFTFVDVDDDSVDFILAARI